MPFSHPKTTRKKPVLIKDLIQEIHLTEVVPPDPKDICSCVQCSSPRVCIDPEMEKLVFQKLAVKNPLLPDLVNKLQLHSLLRED